MKINFKKNSIISCLSHLFFLAIITFFSFQACVTVVGGGYPQEARRGPPRYSEIEGPWYANVNNHPGKLEFYRVGGGWNGRIYLEESRQWEDLMEVSYDSRTGSIYFTRPNGNQRYSGTVSGNHITGTLSSPYGTFPWEARREEYRERGTDLSKIEGPWYVNVNNHPGRLEFYRAQSGIGGRIWLEESQQWEELTEISFDSYAGHLYFTRPNGNQRYSGNLSGDRIMGTLSSPYGNFQWEARRGTVSLQRVHGSWQIIVNNHPGRLEFYWVRDSVGIRAGRIWLDESRRWEELTEISFDPHTGNLQFTRSDGSQRYSGTVMGNQIKGSLSSPYGTFPWAASRP